MHVYYEVNYLEKLRNSFLVQLATIEELIEQLKRVYASAKSVYKLHRELGNIFGSQLSSLFFFYENATLLWKNGYKWIIQIIAHR